tara:strand:+ start:4336 stop:5286 length:951 start_codon:yes stop_codon:yes gene_type:complete
MNKTISINPDLFKYTSKNSSRKNGKKGKTEKTDIKVRSSSSEKQQNKILRKQHILRYLRQQQENNYKKLLQNEEQKVKTKKPISSDFNDDFHSSLDYLKSLPKNEKSHNYSVKNYQPSNVSAISDPLEPLVHNDFDNHEKSSIVLSKPVISNVSSPNWGCLKNGRLPTYKNWKQMTQKKHETPTIQETIGINSSKPELFASMKAKREKPQSKLSFLKQKKTVRRNYKVGRSNVFSKVAVLVSNKTIRNNIMNKTQELKHISLEDVRRYLIKRGFIRVGSSAPNDVLRKMYETANLMCGEVENHNTENLLYNYLHDG